MKIGLAHPISNYRFNEMCSYTATLSAHTTTTVDINLSGGMPADITNMFFNNSFNLGRMHRIILGPSNNAAWYKKTESFMVKSSALANNRITVFGTIAGTYNASDKVTIIGTGMPGAWYGTYPTSSNQVFAYGTMFNPTNSLLDPYCFQCTDITGANTNYASLNIKRLLPNTYYRLSVYYKSFNQSATAAKLRVYNDIATPTIYTNSNIDMSASSDWTELSTVFFTENVVDEDNFLLLWFPLNCNATTFTIANIALTHASYNTGTDYTTNGYSNIDELPDENSVFVKRIHVGSKLKTNIQGYKQHSVHMNNTILPITRYDITMNFSYMSDANLKTLYQIIEWQNKGFFVNFWPELEGVPYCLTGKISINGDIRRPIYDLSYNSFKFSFTEAIL